MPIPDPETVIDHFKIWETEKRDSGWSSFTPLLDQFLRRDKRELEGRPSQIEWIGNPVEKDGKEILHEEPHLTGWRMQFKGDDGPPTGRVTTKTSSLIENGSSGTLVSLDTCWSPPAKILAQKNLTTLEKRK